MAIFFIVAGVVAFVYGAMTALGVIKTDISKDSSYDKKYLSQKSRYFIGRYWSGMQGMIAGIGAVGLGLILYFSQ
jgi:hypothetical protein